MLIFVSYSSIFHSKITGSLVTRFLFLSPVEQLCFTGFFKYSVLGSLRKLKLLWMIQENFKFGFAIPYKRTSPNDLIS